MLIKKTFALALISAATLTACTPQTSNTTPEEQEVISEVVEIMTEEQPTETAITSNATYEDYNEARYNELLGQQPFAIFFHAQWCPTCRKMEKDISEELSTFPENTVILKADFDTEAALKQQYGINSQSTIVIINAQGEALETLAAPSNNKLKQAIQNSQQ